MIFVGSYHKALYRIFLYPRQKSVLVVEGKVKAPILKGGTRKRWKMDQDAPHACCNPLRPTIKKSAVVNNSFWLYSDKTKKDS